jgi:hypothetical protein
MRYQLQGRRWRGAQVRRTGDKADDPDRVDWYVVARHLAEDAPIRQATVPGERVDCSSVRLQGSCQLRPPRMP